MQGDRTMEGIQRLVLVPLELVKSAPGAEEQSPELGWP